MSTTWRTLLLSFCLWHLFVTAIAQETCLYSPKRNGICVPYEDCKELHNKIFFPNEYCPRNTVCCPNVLTTPPANDRIFSGILPSVYSNDNNLEPLPPLPDRVLKIWDIAATDNNPTTSLRPEIIKKEFQNPTQKSWTENADANEQALPPLPDSVLKIWDIPTSDVNPKAFKNAVQIKPQTRFMSEQDFQEIDAYNKFNNQEAPPPLPDNILKIWDDSPADVKPNLTLDPNSAKNELRKPPQAGFIYFPGSGNQLNNITPPTRLPIFSDYPNPSDVKLNKYYVPKTAKNTIQMKPQTRFMSEENFQGIDAHNKLTNQEAPSPLYDNILKIWGNPDTDVKPNKNLGSTVKNEFRSPPQADLKPLSVDRPVYFPGSDNQLNTITPPTRLPLNEFQNPSSPTDNLLRNFNKESSTKSTLNVKQKHPINDLWKQPKIYGIPPISAAQAKADEEFFKNCLIRIFNN
ncbi:unnamed protein product [Ceratitis capitata]|uniref:(Mediterranean fruit fly) hypothetical protein n=1 Tax=Ceratitis capitata TaxID=7213 RepID=A0A811V4C0_CERCA|nr:unnamed protein product [Ceratitis capitata]